MLSAYICAVFAPFAGFLLAGLFGHRLGRAFSNSVTCALMLLAAGCSIYVLYDVALVGHTKLIDLWTMMHVGKLRVTWALFFNPLTAIMIMVVNSVSCLVHIYAVGYMSHDHSPARFMAYLSLFTFMMLMLVTSDNLIQLFFGWEGVGLASYLLIGFWHHKNSANAAAMKAFIVNRVGDIGLALGIAATYYLFNSVEISTVLAQVHEMSEQFFTVGNYDIPALEVVALLFFIGAMGKSAQLGLHTWLPDAMEGPTPVSALIHAATMVTAGVFMVARMSILFEAAPMVKNLIVVVGATTALFAASVAITQNDIKRIIAYSTCSQLGYMFFAAGLGVYHLAIFHLVTHAFFKALLFLGSGAVIHALSDEQDIRRMGGIWRLIPVTYVLMWVGNLALAGIPFFAGYYSKDAILESALITSGPFAHYAYVVGIVVAFLTAFYSWRLLILTFHGKPRADDKVMSHIHEPGLSMLIPLIVLGIGAIFAGFFGSMYIYSSDFWRESLVYMPAPEVHLNLLQHILPTLCGIGGITLAFTLYMWNQKIVAWVTQTFKGLYQFLLNKWYIDELYEMLFVTPAKRLAQFFWVKGDMQLIDGYGPNGIAQRVRQIASRVSQVQTGYLYHYALSFIVGFVGLLMIFIWTR